MAFGDAVVNVPDIDDDRLHAIVNDVFYGDHELHLLGQRILRRQDRLREIVSDRAWRRFLRLEEATTLRLDVALTKVAREAFLLGWKAGRGHARHG